MSGEVKLKPCPFCGNAVGISHSIGDFWVKCFPCGASGGVRKDEESAIADWNHRAPEPGALEVIQELIEKLEDIQNRGSYLSLSSCLYLLKEAGRILRDNRREYASSRYTSVIRWNRYDGTPETLPSDMEDVILFRCNGGSNNGGMGITFIQWDGQEAQYWRCGGACFDVNVGDLWAYLPEPPEGME